MADELLREQRRERQARMLGQGDLIEWRPRIFFRNKPRTVWRVEQQI